ncbi:DNA repair ATPase [Streptomyces sp. NPDC007084]|uniref:DNA repair ATPase n=1 Tax=Streptomyces sp. NPDC007084 TaxID=3154313 RepID=UPI0034535106
MATGRHTGTLHTGTLHNGTLRTGTRDTAATGPREPHDTAGTGTHGTRATTGTGTHRTRDTGGTGTHGTRDSVETGAHGTRDSVETGAYEVLRDRLTAQAAELARRAEALNSRRVEEFGSVRLRLTGTERLRTEHPCVPRDVVAVADVLLFGGVPRSAVAAETAVGDVFALYDRELNRLPEGAVPGLLDDPAFRREFAALYRYYRQARLLRLRRVDGRLLAVFQTGEKAGDIRVLRWALGADGGVSFLDARGDRDHTFPPSHDVVWTAATREDHVLGRHPHVSVLGEVFVSSVGGALTVKTEDDTETGEGVYAEPVAEPLQALADADIAHARVGALILLRVRPYKEDAHRYLVFDTLTGSVVRLDAVGQACRRLPDDAGIVFPGGYRLAGGAYKTYDLDVAELEFEREVRAPNGEDVLYAFHARAEGRTLLLPYNVIRKEVGGPLSCHGSAFFEDGTLMVLRADGEEPARVHPLQVWRSPFVSDTYAASAPAGSGPLARIGNADLVRGVADCLSVTRAVAETTPTAEVYEALSAACVRAADAHHWFGDEELGDLLTPLEAVRDTAGQVLAEFETVLTLTRQAAEAFEAAEGRIAAVVRRLRGEAPREATAWVDGLTELRQAQGHLLTLKDLRYSDAGRIDRLAAEATEDLAAFGQRAVTALAREDAFAAHHASVEQLVAEAESISRVAETAPLTARLDELTEGLQTVTEVVAGIDMSDATVRTSVLERVAGVLGDLNRARATLDARRRALLDQEGRAEFAAEFALLGQAVTAALTMADSPEACDEQLARLLVRLENLETRFAEFDGHLGELADKRAEIYEVFSARKQGHADDRARRADQLVTSATRVLETIARRSAALKDADEVSAFFASDPMAAKVRRTAGELRALGDTVRAEELDGRLKAARQEAARALRDRIDLYADDGRTIRLGGHRFAVNTQPLDLTLVPDADGLAFALAGTDYRSPVTDPAFAATRPFWNRHLPSESPDVYRAEHLAARLLSEHGPTVLAKADLPALVRKAAEEAYDEGYERGVHDHDATVILTALLPLYEGAGPLRHEPAARAAAQLFWAHGTTSGARAAWARRAASLARARATFGPVPSIAELRAELATAIETWFASDGTTVRFSPPGGTRTGSSPDGAAAGAWGAGTPSASPPDGAALWSPPDGAALSSPPGGAALSSPPGGAALWSPPGGVTVRPSPDPALAPAAAAYLFEELTLGPEGFALSGVARSLLGGFRDAVGGAGYDEDLRELAGLAARRQVVQAWLSSYVAATGAPCEAGDLAEAAAAELCPDLPRYASDAPLSAAAENLLGTHPRVTGRRLPLRVDEFLARTDRFRELETPAFRAYQRRRTALVTAERARLRLDDHRPRAMASFVRGRLVDEVYLPLIGDNLAKQLGTADESRRTGTGGLLLLVSPPGYGKTTLMEYVADRLGLLLVKVSGPALGNKVTSLDPAEAPNVTARKEVEKINFALAAGTNTLLYLDDIQHTSPELLEKFIALCDDTRRMEGVREGEPYTYDLRGKHFAVCMAGNPYTESGARFRVPDMLANRADVWNLGDVLTGKADAFALSFVENALTANPVLAPLAGRDRADLDVLIRLARHDPAARPDQLAHPYAPAELERVLAVLRHLLTARETVLAVNAAYIASAAQSDDARTEPPFQLQGSYRNMNKIAQRVLPVMNEAELAAVVDDHYTAEAQTLTTGAEANLLKLAELRGTLTPAQAARWTEVKTAYARPRARGV